MNTKKHWQEVYQRKSPQEQTWYQRRPDVSLELIEKVDHDGLTRLVDVGGGASTLVDHLLDEGDFEVTVVDLASAALEASKTRLGDRAEEVRWVVADLREKLDLGGPFDIWHDRAVLHFLREDRDQRAYLDNLQRHLSDGGHLVLSTFGPEGPEKCSGLPVCRYSSREMAQFLGDSFHLVDTRQETHPTPWGGTQEFAYGLFRYAP